MKERKNEKQKKEKQKNFRIFVRMMNGRTGSGTIGEGKPWQSCHVLRHSGTKNRVIGLENSEL
jgi:hypothetical protein